MVTSDDIRNMVREAMADAWNEICSDTEHHPLDIQREGKKLFFKPAHWADATAALIERRMGGRVEPSRRRERGPIEILCEEIGFRFDRRFETQATLVAFVRELVSEIEDMRTMQVNLVSVIGKAPSDDSGRMLREVQHMLTITNRKVLIEKCAELHLLADELNPDEAYPTDHLIDMLSSCVSAIRFGLDLPCMSRHAASAAQHVWKQVYGVSRFDGFSPAWQKNWAREQFQNALVAQIAKI